MNKAIERLSEAFLSHEQWRDLAAEFPTQDQIQRGTIQTLIQSLKLNEAYETAQQLWETPSMRSTAKLLLAEIEWLRFQWGEARRHLEDVARVDPSNIAVVVAICEFYFRAEMWDDAEIALREFERREPDSVVARCNLALVLERRGAREEALARYQQVYAAHPECLLAKSRLIDLGVLKGSGETR